MYLVDLQGLKGLEVSGGYGMKSKALWWPAECLWCTCHCGEN